MARRPWFRSQRVAIAIGITALVVAWLALYDAWERRGARTPLILRPILPT